MRFFVIVLLSLVTMGCAAHDSRPMFDVSDRTHLHPSPEIVKELETVLDKATSASWPSSFYTVLGRGVILTQDALIRREAPDDSLSRKFDRIHIEFVSIHGKSWLLYKPRQRLYASDRKPVTAAEAEYLLELAKVALGQVKPSARLEEWLAKLEKDERVGRALESLIFRR